MFSEIEQYENNGHFFFDGETHIKDVCNAPKSGVGIYLVYALKNGKIELIYVGSIGKITKEGFIKTRKEGMYDKIVKGVQFGEIRNKAWKKQLFIEDIEALDVYWYETFNKKHIDIPTVVAGNIIQQFFNIYGKLPKWNEEY